MPDNQAPQPQGVPVWSPEGELGTIPAFDGAAQLRGYRLASPEDVHEEILQREYGGAGQQLATAAEAAGSALTFGISPKLETMAGLTTPEAIRGRAEANPISHGVGTAAGIIAPLALTAGAAAPAEAAAEGAGAVARGAASLTAPALIARAGRAAEGLVGGAGLPGAAGRILPAVAGGAAEGALYGASDLNEKALLGDPHLTWERAASELGLSALFGGALGGAGKTLSDLMPEGLRASAADKLGTVEARANAKAAGAIQSTINRALKTRSQDALDDISREFGERGLVYPGSTPAKTLGKARALISQGRQDAVALTKAADAVPDSPRWSWDDLRAEIEPEIMQGLRSKGSMAQAANAFKGKLDDFSAAYAGRELNVSDLHALRTDVDQSVYNFGRSLDPFTKPAAAPLKKVRDVLSDKLEEAMEQTGIGATAWNEALRKQEVGIVARSFALHGVVRERGNNLVSLSDILGGGFLGHALGGGSLGSIGAGLATHEIRQYAPGAIGWGARTLRGLLENGGSEEAIAAASRMARQGGGGAAPAAPGPASADLGPLRVDSQQITRFISRRAAEAEPDASATLRSVASDKAELVGDTGTHQPPEHALKGIGRIHDKVVASITKRVGIIPEQIANDDVKDALRYTYRIPDEHYVAQSNAALNALQAKGYKVLRFRNFFLPETDPGNPYRGVNVALKAPNGTPMELQFHTPLSLATKSRMHPLYEEYRKTGINPVRHADLGRQMDEISGQIPRPAGIDSFTGPKREQTFPIAQKTTDYATDQAKTALVQQTVGGEEGGNEPQDVFAQAASARQRINALAAEGARASEWPTRDGGRALVTQDPSKPGRWRVTKVDASGQPTGHIEAATHRDALREAHGIGADLGSDTSAGAETRIISPHYPAGENARYALVEAQDLVASHRGPSFRPNAAYPEGVQERAYHLDKNEQEKVRKGAQNLNPNLLLTDTPTPVDGPPIVTSGKPLVMGGNGRTMMIQGAFKDDAQREAYRSALLAKAQQFGVSPDQVRQMKAPVLVRQLSTVSSDSTKEQQQAAVRRFNEGMTQGLSPQARAVAEARAMSPETVEQLGGLLAGEEERSLRDLMRDNPENFIGPLERDGIITPQNRAQFVAGGNLTDEAKDRIEGMFLGRVVGTPDRLSATPPGILGKVERTVPYLLKVAAVNPEADQIPAVRTALDLLSDAKRRRLSLGDLLAQRGLFGNENEADVEGEALAHLFDTLSARNIGQRFQQWAQVAAVDPRQGSLFGGAPSPEQIKALLVGGTNVTKAANDPGNTVHQKLLDMSKKADKRLAGGARAIFEEKKTPDEKFAHGGLVTQEHFPDVATHLRDYGSNLDSLAGTVSQETSGLAVHAPATASAAHTFAARMVTHLGGRLPIEPPRRLLDRPFRPTGGQLTSFNRHHEVASHGPAVVLHHLARGTLHPDHLQASQALFPGLHAQAQQLVAERMADHLAQDDGRIPHRLRGPLSMFLGTPLEYAQTPEAILSAQSIYEAAAAPPVQAAPQGRSRNVETHADRRAGSPSQGNLERMERA